MLKFIPLYFAFFLLLVSCEFKAEVKIPEEKKSNVNSKIRNGIKIKDNGLRISQAFLLYEDGTLVPESNEAKVGQKIQLRLIIDSGWNAVGGKVYPNASEKIETNDGATVLDEKDLFAGLTDGISEKDAGVISLSAVITRIDKLCDYYLVNFRVWDKKGSADATGSYKFYIK